MPAPFFLLPIQSNWKGSWKLIPNIIEKAFDAKTRLFRRNQALSFLSAAFKNQNLQESAPAKTKSKAVATLEEKILLELKAANGTTKPRYLCELLGLLYALYVSKAPLNWDGKVKEALEDFRENVPKNRHFQDVKKAFNKIGAPLKVKVVQGSEKKKEKEKRYCMTIIIGLFFVPKSFLTFVNIFLFITRKRQNSEVNETSNGTEENSPPNKKKNISNGSNDFFSDLKADDADINDENKKKKKKKRKHNKEALEEKKRDKMYALQGQFEGMDIPSFADVEMSENMNFKMANGEGGEIKVNGEVKVAAEKVKKKKKKFRRGDIGFGGKVSKKKKQKA